MFNLDNYQALFKEIDRDKDSIIQTLIAYSEINTGSYNLDGINTFTNRLKNDFACLQADKLETHKLSPFSTINAQHEIVENPLGSALSIQKRTKLNNTVLLSAHLDTVFSKESSFQKTQWLDPQTLNGPGVADIKGGIVIILWALKYFERLETCNSIGWEVLFNPDEEIGSPGSSSLIKEKAAKHQLGLVFEPCLENGSLVSNRKGSLNFSILCEGLAAHAGRHFNEGINAIE
ncbi:hypothetical protein AB751O23_DG_00030, partial [Chlamydiales bacterium SCGC AB-751-O23]